MAADMVAFVDITFRYPNFLRLCEKYKGFIKIYFY